LERGQKGWLPSTRPRLGHVARPPPRQDKRLLAHRQHVSCIRDWGEPACESKAGACRSCPARKPPPSSPVRPSTVQCIRICSFKTEQTSSRSRVCTPFENHARPSVLAQDAGWLTPRTHLTSHAPHLARTCSCLCPAHHASPPLLRPLVLTKCRTRLGAVTSDRHHPWTSTDLCPPHSASADQARPARLHHRPPVQDLSRVADGI
jgi:hypothetical protein